MRNQPEFLRGEIRAGEDGNGGSRVKFRASTAALDRHDTKILPEGIDTSRFETNPIFVWGHDAYGGWEVPKMENVLGRVVGIVKSSEALDIDVEFADESVNPKGAQALRMVRAGLLNAVSIGFRILARREETDPSSNKTYWVYEKTELLEVSLVPIPSNPEALALVRSMAGASPSTTGADVDARAAEQDRDTSLLLETLRSIRKSISR